MNKQDLMVQKEGKAKIPTTWPSNGIVRVTHLSGSPECLAKAVQSTAAGILVVHLNNDYDAAGAKVYTLVALTAAALVNGALDLASAYEVPCVFDEIRSTGTTIALSALTVWI
jgi:hypothetical protein